MQHNLISGFLADKMPLFGPSSMSIFFFFHVLSPISIPFIPFKNRNVHFFKSVTHGMQMHYCKVSYMHAALIGSMFYGCRVWVGLAWARHLLHSRIEHRIGYCDVLWRASFFFSRSDGVMPFCSIPTMGSPLPKWHIANCIVACGPHAIELIPSAIGHTMSSNHKCILLCFCIEWKATNKPQWKRFL